jgi:hypothetical protein
MLIIWAKVGISLGCLLAIVAWFWFRKPIQNWLHHHSEQSILTISLLLLRLCPFLLVFVVLDYTPSSDLDGFFGQATEAAKGKLVYRDFRCMYSPLFPYLNALALHFWFDRKAIIVVMMLMEGLALVLTNQFYKNQITKSERLFKSVLYLLLPGSLVLCVLGGQEDVWMWLVAVAAYLTWQRTRQLAWFGLVLALGFLLTKAVFVLFCPALLLLVARPQKWLPSLVATGAVAVAVLYYYTGWQFLDQPLNEAATLRAPNWASVVNPWVFDGIGVGTKWWNWAGLLTTVILTTYTAYRVRLLPFERAFSAVWVICYGTMMAVQQSAYSNYIFIFLLPLTFIWIDFNNRKEAAYFLIFNALCAIHPSLWWRLKSPIYREPSAIFIDTAHTADYLLQVGVVGGTFYFVWLVWKKAVGTR